MNLIKCEKLEKSMVELQFSIDAETYKSSRRAWSNCSFPSMLRPIRTRS